MDLRLYRLTVLGYQPKELVRVALSREPTVELRRAKWTVWGSHFPSYDEHDTAAGYIVKYRDEALEVFEEGQRDIVKGVVPDAIQWRAFFVIDFKYWIVAIQAVSGVSDNVLGNVLQSIIVEGNGGILVKTHLEPVIDREEFVAHVRSLNRIDKMTINVHPSNPRFKESWRVVDNDMQGANIGNWTSRVEPKEPDIGIMPNEDSTIWRSLLMAADGYGNAIIRGLKDGYKTVIRSRFEAKTVAIDEDQVKDPMVQQVISAIEKHEKIHD